MVRHGLQHPVAGPELAPSRQPPGVRIRWLVHANCARPLPPPAGDRELQELLVRPLSNQFTIRLGTIASASGS